MAEKIWVVSSGCTDHLLEDVGNNDEKVRRDWIALPEALFALDPVPRSVVQRYGCFYGGEQVADPVAETRGEAPVPKNFEQGIPGNRVEGFSKVHLDDHSGCFSFVQQFRESAAYVKFSAMHLTDMKPVWSPWTSRGCRL